MVDDARGEGVLRHGRKQRIVRSLHDGGAAPRADRRCPDHAVIEDAGHQHPDRARAEAECDGSEQGADRRPVPVLRRAIRQGDAMVVDKQVVVGNTHVNQPGSNSAPWAAEVVGSGPVRSMILASTLGALAGMCRATKIAYGRSTGRREANLVSASTPPADAPTATTPRSAQL